MIFLTDFCEFLLVPFPRTHSPCRYHIMTISAQPHPQNDHLLGPNSPGPISSSLTESPTREQTLHPSGYPSNRSILSPTPGCPSKLFNRPFDPPIRIWLPISARASSTAHVPVFLPSCVQATRLPACQLYYPLAHPTYCLRAFTHAIQNACRQCKPACLSARS